MFVDEAEIYIRSGQGGPGCISFRREKYIPRGGPDGGDGGKGGDVLMIVDPQTNTLVAFSGRHHWIAENGHPGMGKNRSGKAGDDLVIPVPPGTVVFDRDNRLRLRELTRPGQQVVLLRGGRGGSGNRRFASPTHQAPRKAHPGGPSEERWLRLELKLIADVGLVGLPNAGKSTFLARNTHARPKIADYPFTTLVPQLGIVELPGLRQYVLADIPGLIEGAHDGAGLGHMFLRHVERTRVLLHLIDLCPPEGQPEPAEAHRIVCSELQQSSAVLAAKPQIVVANKMDLTGSAERLDALRAQLDREVHPISAVTGEGIAALQEVVWRLLASAASQDRPAAPPPATGGPSPSAPEAQATLSTVPRNDDP